MKSTTKQLVILGAGTAGTMIANKLSKRLPSTEWRITVVAKDDNPTKARPFSAIQYWKLYAADPAQRTTLPARRRLRRHCRD